MKLSGRGKYKMKRLLLPLLALAFATPVYAFGRKYKDQYEAKLACDKWAAKGLIFTFEDSERVWRDPEFAYKGYKYKVFTNEGITRFCDFKKENNQYIGYEATKIKEGHYKEYVFENMDKGWRKKKSFKF